jgi:hypothetical protein
MTDWFMPPVNHLHAPMKRMALPGAIRLTLPSIAQAPALAPEIWPAGLRDASQRIEAIKVFAGGITRNDAEAIAAGWQGRNGWDRSIRRAEKDAGLAKDPQAFGLVLRTLYASYPSLHSHMELRADIDYRTTFGTPYLPFTMKVGMVGPGVSPDAVFISSVSADQEGLSGARLAVGDQVTALNGRPMSYWLSRTATVCRRNSQWQCYDDFDKQFRNGLLGWDPRQTLRIESIRDGQDETLAYVPQAVPTRSDQRTQTGCGEDGTSYQGFERVYTGWNLCAFTYSRSRIAEHWVRP